MGNRLVEHEVHAQGEHLANTVLPADYRDRERGVIETGKAGFAKQRVDFLLRGAIDNHHIEALLRQADRGSDEVRARLDLNAKFQENAAQNFCSGCIKAYQERCESHTCPSS